jgi:hypothetical protein
VKIYVVLWLTHYLSISLVFSLVFRTTKSFSNQKKFNYLIFLEAANISSPSPVAPSPPVENVKDDWYERLCLRRRMLSDKPKDLRTRKGKQWLKDFRAAGFTWPLGQFP